MTPQQRNVMEADANTLICCAGEAMVEMAATEDPGVYQRGVAGDSFNTAIYLARAGMPVTYLTSLGDDAYSDDIVSALAAERIDTSLINRQPGQLPGLYTIENDSAGERHFSYWRDHAPARKMFATLPDLPALSHFYFTGITLAVSRDHADILTALLKQLRANSTEIIFDPNYRPALWQDVEQARKHYLAVLPYCSLVLPSAEDEWALWGIDQAKQSISHYLGQGIEEVVLKGEKLTTRIHSSKDELVQRADEVTAIDTTGAGDAFNAAYLAARIAGRDLETALNAAQALAAQVVQHRGAILPPVQEGD